MRAQGTVASLTPGHEAEFLLYQGEDGRTRIEVRFDDETAWLSLGQMAQLFQRDKSVISRHVANVFDEGELAREGTVAYFATVQRETSPPHAGRCRRRWRSTSTTQ
jgi:hypothetical protein